MPMSGSSEKPTVLFVSPVGMMPIAGGGAARIWGIIRYLRAEGFRVELVANNHFGHNAAIEALVDKLWVYPPVGGASFKSRLRQWGRRAKLWLERRHADPVASILERNRKPGLELLAAKAACAAKPVAAIAAFAWMARALDYMPPGTLRLIDTIDVQCLRAERARAAGGDLTHARCSREDEIAELTRADVLIAIQPEEAAELKAMCSGLETITLLHAVDVPEVLPASPTEEIVLYVGNLYDPNVRGLRDFLEFAWPRVLAARPSARLIVCGTIRRALRPAPRGVSLEGRVPDLTPYYRRAAVVINPVPYGSGLKIKTVEALAQGKCFVGTAESIRGLGPPEKLPVVLADIRDGMAERIAELLANPVLRRQYEQAAWQYAQQNLRPEHVYRPLGELLKNHIASQRTQT